MTRRSQTYAGASSFVTMQVNNNSTTADGWQIDFNQEMPGSVVPRSPEART